MKRNKWLSGILLMGILVFGACSKFDSKYNIFLPIVQNTLDSTTSTSATFSITVIDQGLPPDTAQGLCWGTSPNPTYDSGNSIIVSDTAGLATDKTQFNIQITGLTPRTTYYARAYAINVKDKKRQIGYGSQITFRTPAVSPYYMGEYWAGGYVFYLDTTGQHGLVCDTTDLSINVAGTVSDSMVWNVRKDTLIATGTGIDSGAYNTQNFLAYYGYDSTSAVFACKTYNGGGYTDWWLPSKDELNQIYLNLYSRGFGNLSPTGIYWSSSEFLADEGYYAWSQYFGDGYQYYFNQGLSLRVRAVRAF